MTTIQIHFAESDAQLAAIAPVLLQLRPAFTKDTLIAQIKEQQKDGYRIAYAESGGEVLCVAGFVFGTKLSWGKSIYIDDLVTAEQHRSTGAGAALIEWIKTYARESGCQQLHLDSGVHRFGAHKFYLRHGFNIEAHHFCIRDLSKTK